MGLDQVFRAAIGTTAEHALLVLLAVGARVGVTIWLTPFLGGRLTPATVRLGVAAALVIVLFPQLAPVALALSSMGTVGVVAVLVKEALVGLALGFVVSLVFWAAQTAGWLADTARGASMAEVMVPQSSGRTTPLGSLLLQLSVVLFLALGGHRLFIAALARSYEVLPITSFPAAGGIRQVALLSVDLTAELISLAVVLAAPVIATLVVADLTLGWINRFTPQLNVFFVSMPLKALLGIAALAASAALVIGALPEALDLGLQQLERMLTMLGAR